MEKHIEILVDHKEKKKKEEAYKAINEQYHETEFDGYQDGIELMNHIAKIPAADVVEVRNGRWIADKEDVEWGNYLIRYRCSECKERPHFDKDKYKFILSPYCPNCGAKMNLPKKPKDEVSNACNT